MVKIIGQIHQGETNWMDVTKTFWFGFPTERKTFNVGRVFVVNSEGYISNNLKLSMLEATLPVFFLPFV